jgi:diguanylate cyclase (GGDEF)-like protein/PAS domain S-box-containing protein
MTVIRDDRPLFSAPRALQLDVAEPVSFHEIEPWKIAVVDDDQDVHAVTRLVLSGFRYKDRPIKILNAYSGAEARKLLKQESDIAVVLLDVVMETEHAGLDIVKYIREEINDSLMRIILRTGQPGQAPEGKVISEYDINDYKEKSELSAQSLVTSVTAALRGYDDLITIQELASSNESLEQQVRERTAELTASNRVLQHQQALLAEAQKIASIGNYEWNLSTQRMFWSDQVFRILGKPAGSVAPSLDDLLQAVPEQERELVQAALQAAISEHEPFDFEHSIRRADGTIAYVHQQGEVHFQTDGQALRLVGILQDVTQRHRAEETMRKLSAAVEQTADSVMITDADGLIEYVNAAFTKMSGYNSSEVLGKTPRILKSEQMPDIFYRRLWSVILKGEVFSDVMINKRKDGTQYHEARTITPQKDPRGKVTHFIATGRDISDQIVIQERIQHLAHHDALTGLPNRILLLDRLEQAMTRSKWRSRHVAILFMDMDRFKVINDTLGHATGDELLKAMAQRLAGCVRDGDTVARLGGDEFSIVLNDIASREDIERRAQAVLDAAKVPFVIEGRELFVTTSIGISMYPQDGDNSQVLLKRADVAMYNAKVRGKNNFQFYTDRDEADELKRLSLETGLRRALEREEFFLVFQPQVEATTRKINCLEALLRWRRPDGEIVQPINFIGLLEETGMIQAVGDWVMFKACSEVQAMRQEGRFPCRVAVNISLHQFRQQGFVRRVREVLRQTGLPAEALELEITEGVLVDDVKEATQILEELNAIGVRLSIDDFGTGYSSMHYLRRLPFDTIKIDKSFIDGLPHNKDDCAIVTAIITLAHSMELEVVAEGVETREQFAFVSSQGCQLIQGYFFSPPVSFEAVAALVQTDGFQEGGS